MRGRSGGRRFSEAADAVDDGDGAEDLVRGARDADELDVAAEEDLPIRAFFVAVVHDQRGHDVSGGLGGHVEALSSHPSPLQMLGDSAARVRAHLARVRGLSSFSEVVRMLLRRLLDLLAVHQDRQRLLLPHELDRLVVLPIDHSNTAFAPSYVSKGWS